MYGGLFHLYLEGGCDFVRFIDKNGFYAPVPDQNKMNSEVKMIFSWDAISDLSFDKGIDSLNLNRLTLKTDEGFLTFDEFTSTSVSKSQGSCYLQ